MRTRLVVNADDLGLHPEIDAGILRAHREGIVTSATVLVTGRSAPDAVAAAKAQGLALGVHLALCSTLPCAAPAEQVPSVAPGGRLRPGWAAFVRAWLLGQVRREEVDRELAAQLERARALGAEPDHLDSHQHLHLLPGLSERVEALAVREGLPLRWPVRLPAARALRETPGAAAKAALLWSLGSLRKLGPKSPPASRARRVLGMGVSEAGGLDERVLLQLLGELPAGDVELGCHPGAGEPYVPEDPGWHYAWQAECDALCSPRVRQEIEARGIELVTYGALPTDAHRAEQEMRGGVAPA